MYIVFLWTMEAPDKNEWKINIIDLKKKRSRKYYLTIYQNNNIQSSPHNRISTSQACEAASK